jgi:hypothetical protein
MDKHGWDLSTTTAILWQEHGYALASLPRRMNKTITQFNHKWLPLNDSHSIQASGTGKLCPFCLSCNEDHQHFLCCSHQTVTESWQVAATTIKAKLISYDKHVHRQLIQLIGRALTDWKTTKEPPLPDNLPQQFIPLFQNQSQIGWHHIIYGRFSKEWYKALSFDHIKGSQWVSYTIRTIWFCVYDIWKKRCQTHHGLTQDDQHKRQLLRLTPQVQNLYDQRHDLNIDDQYIFNINVDEMLSKPIVTIKTWVHKATLRIKNYKKRLKAKQRQIKAKITKIHPFFTIKSSTNQPTNHNKKAKQTKPRQLQTSTLTRFFPKIRRHTPPPSQNDLFPP